MLPDWPTTSPQAAGLPVEALDAAHQQLPFTFPDVTSLLVARGGQLAFEQYFGIAPDEEQDTQSVTKSLISLLTGRLLERGVVRPSQPLLSLLPEMADAVTDERWRAVTLEHLLGMTSGLPSELTDSAYDDAWFLSADPVRFSLGQPLVAAPGEVFHYSNAGVHLLGAALAKAAGQPLETLLHRHLLAPLGVSLGHWPRDRTGRVWASGGLHLSPRGLLRVGQLMLQGGHWQGRPLVSAEWLGQSTCPRTKTGSYSFMEGLPEYGWLWWRSGPGESAGLYATGFGGQYLAVFPALDLVMVMTGRVGPHPNHRSVIRDLAAQVSLRA